MTSTCYQFSAWKYENDEGEWWAWSCSDGEQHQGFPNLQRALEDATERHAHSGRTEDR